MGVEHRAPRPLRAVRRRAPPAPRGPCANGRGLAVRPGGPLVTAALLVDTVWGVLETVEDPELPIAITDLGLVGDVQVADGRVSVRLVPTWTGCPALDVIRARVQGALRSLPRVREAALEYAYDEPWTLHRMTASGRE